jgi:hypothetical protein
VYRLLLRDAIERRDVFVSRTALGETANRGTRGSLGAIAVDDNQSARVTIAQLDGDIAVRRHEHAADDSRAASRDSGG